MAYQVIDPIALSAAPEQASYSVSLSSLGLSLVNDDWLLLGVVCSATSGTLSVAGSGWSEISELAVSSGQRTALYMVKVASGTAADPTISLSAGTGAWQGVLMQWRDPDATVFYDSVTSSSTNANTLTSGTMTPSTNDCTIVYFATHRVASNYGGGRFLSNEVVGEVQQINQFSSGTLFYSVGTIQQSTAVDTAKTYYASGTHRLGIITLAVKNKVGGKFGRDCRAAIEKVKWFGTFGTAHESLGSLVLNAPSTFCAWAGAPEAINGIPLDTSAATITSPTTYPPPYYETFSAFQTGLNTAGTFTGAWFAISTTNMSGKIFSLEWFIQTTGTHFGSEGVLLAFGDSATADAGNAAVFQLSSRSTIEDMLLITSHIALETATLYTSIGSIDWTNINKIGVFFHRVGSSTTVRNVAFRNMLLHGNSAIVGGNSDRPLDIRYLDKALNGWGYVGVCELQGDAVLVKTNIQVGDGTIATYFDATGTLTNTPQAYSIVKQPFWIAPANTIDLTIKASANDTINLKSSALIAGTGGQQKLTFDAATSGAATYSLQGEIISNVLFTGNTSVPVVSATFSECGEIDAKGSDWTDCTISKTTSTDAAIAFSEDGGSMTRCTIDVTGTSAAYHLELGTATTAITLTDVTFTGTPGTDKIHVRKTTGTVTITTSGTTSLVAGDVTSEGATVSIVAPTVERGIAFSGLQTGTSIQVFTSGTQTKLYGDNSTAGSTFAFDDATVGSITVDYTIQKVNYLPIRVTGVVLTGAVGGQLDVTITQIPDRAYVASSGLTYGTTAVVTVGTNPTTNPGTKTFQVTTATTGQNWYSFWIEQWIDKGNATGEDLANVEFPLAANGPNSFTLNDGWTFSDGATSIAYLSRDGLRYLNTSDVLQKAWAAILTSGVPAGAIVRYQQTDGGTTVDAANTGEMDQLVQIYDVGNYDYRGYLVLKVQEQGYDQVEANVVTLYGNLEDQLYVVGLTPLANGVATGDPGLTITITDHGATPVTWNGKDFSITITDNASPSSGTDIMRELRYNFETGGTYQGKDAFNWHDLVQTNGTNFKTVRGIVYGDVGATLKGVRVVTNGGTDPHPDFNLFTADDGTTYSPPVVANISITSMPTAVGASRRLQISNQSALSAAAWQATTAYSLGALRKRTSGIGTENTAGLYLRCTTAGTSAGVEPTWNTTPGGTTTDGTAVWTTYKVLFYDNDPANATYSTTYSDGNEFAGGETVGVRFAEMDAGTSFKTYDNSTIAATSGFSVAVNEIADDVYAANGLDGSSYETTFSPNFTDDYIVLDSNTDFAGVAAYAYFCYTLTGSNGMYQFWGGVTALDTGNYRIEDDILNLYFDETLGFVKQTDNVRIFRKDGTRPALDPTTGGSGIEINWRTPVSVVSTGGSALTPTESAHLLGLTNAPSADTVADAVHDEVIEDGKTFRQITRINSAALAGTTNKVGSTITFKGIDGTTDRIVGTFDAQNNRTGATLDGS